MEKIINKYRPFVILIFTLIIVLLLIIFKPQVKPEEKKYTPPLVEIKKLKMEDIQISVFSQGTVMPGKEVVLSSEISGKVNWISDKLLPGSKFYKNDTLLTFDKRDLELALIIAESNLSQATLNYERELAEFELANKEWNQIGEGKGSSLTLRKPQLNRAKALLASSEAGFEQAQRNLDRSIVKAPFNGIVRTKNADIGAVANPGIPLAQIFSIDYVEIELPINQNEFKFLNDPMKSNANKNKVILSNESDNILNKWIGKIDRISKEINSRTRMQSVYAVVENPYKTDKNKPALKVGMYVNAEILGKQMKNLIRIPRNIINNDRVWLVDKHNNLLEKKIDVLFYDKESAILKTGLSDEEQILLTRLSVMVNGMKVRVK